MLDLTTLEENDIPHVTVAVLPKTKKVTLVTMETRLHVDRFGDIFKLACEAGQIVHGEMKRAIQERTKKLVTAMDMGPRTGSLTGSAQDREVLLIDDPNDH